MSDISGLFESYPRIRPPLTPAHQRLYETEYRTNREGLTLVNRVVMSLEGWMHRRVAKIKGGPILELGAGNLNHFPYESDVTAYDIVEPFEAVYASSPNLDRVREIYRSLADIPENHRYHRIISIAALEHMENLPWEVAMSSLFLEPDGLFQAGIPSEGGFLWGSAWRATTGIAYRLRTGLDYGSLMRHEHLSTAKEIETIIRAFFENVSIVRFPFSFHHLSFYTYIEAKFPKAGYARAFLTC